VNNISLGQKQFRQVGAVLTRDAGDERGFLMILQTLPLGCALFIEDLWRVSRSSQPIYFLVPVSDICRLIPEFAVFYDDRYGVAACAAVQPWRSLLVLFHV